MVLPIASASTSSVRLSLIKVPSHGASSLAIVPRRRSSFFPFSTAPSRRTIATATVEQPRPEVPLTLRSVAKARIMSIDSHRPYRSPALTDKFNRHHTYLRISLTEKCNLRCTYCMPAEGIDLQPANQMLSDSEVVQLARLFVREGVTKIRLTGGEPTVRKGIVDLIGTLNSLRPLGLTQIGMTSNGIALHRKLPTLVDNGLTHLNLSLDTLVPEKFEFITRRQGHSAVLRSLSTARGLADHGLTTKLNVVVMRGFNEDEVVDFVELTRDQNIEVRFIEYMPFSGNKWSHGKMYSYHDMLETIRAKYPDFAKVEDDPNDTSKGWRVPGFTGKVGFITSMTEHFCGTCNRLRITADGNLKVCLFGNAEVSLRDLVRQGASDGELLEIIRLAVGRKREKHAGMEQLKDGLNRPMILIDAPSSQRFPPSRRSSSAFTDSLLSIPFLSSPTIHPLSLLHSYFPSTTHHHRAHIHTSHDFTPAAACKIKSPAPSAPLTWQELAPVGGPATNPLSPTVASLDPSTATLTSPSPPPAPEAAAVRQQPISATATPQLTHIDPHTGLPKMVTITTKPPTTRSATATGRIWLPSAALNLLTHPTRSKKGDALVTAQLAGVMAAKRTSELIPLCHGLMLSGVDVRFEIEGLEVEIAEDEERDGEGEEEGEREREEEGGWVRVETRTECVGSTGVEMEALTAASVALLTVWDMVKAVAGKEMIIDGLMVTKKSGGKSGDWERGTGA